MKHAVKKSDFKWALEPLGDTSNIFTVSLEGIIGVSKSTLLRRMEEHRMIEQELTDILKHNNVFVEYQLEPVWRWGPIEDGGNGMLGDFYDNRTANAYPFQVQVFEDYVDVVRDKIRPYLKDSNDPERAGKPMVLIVERSMFSQLLFWRLQEDDGHTTITQRTRYMRQWVTWFGHVPVPVLIVLLRIMHEDDKGCDDEERLWRELRRVQRRVQARGRGEEMSKEDKIDRKTLEEGGWQDTESGPVFIPNQKIAELKEEDKKALKISIGDQDDVGAPLDQEFMEYNGRLLKRHEEFFPAGTCNPEGWMTKPVGCIHFDASRPYHVDEAALRSAAREIAGYLSTSLVLAGYGPGYMAKGTPKSTNGQVKSVITNGHGMTDQVPAGTTGRTAVMTNIK